MIACGEEGERDEAMRWLGVLSDMSHQVLLSSEFDGATFTAWSLRRAEMFNRILLAKAVRDEAGEVEAVAEFTTWKETLEVIRRNIDRGFQKDEARWGMLASATFGHAKYADFTAAAWRGIEYAAAYQFLMVWCLGAVVLVALMLSLSSVLRVWRVRDDGLKPLWLWIGWKRVAAVIGFGAVVPTVLLMVWMAGPWSSQGYGIHVSIVWLSCELVVWACVLLAMSSWLTVRGLWQRAGELGMERPSAWRVGYCMPAMVVGGLFLAVMVWVWNTWDATEYLEANGAVAMPDILLLFTIPAGVAGLVFVGLWFGGLWVWLNEGVRWALAGGLLIRLALGVIGTVGAMWVFAWMTDAPICTAWGGILMWSIMFGLMGLVPGLFWVMVWLSSPGVPLGLFGGSVMRSMGSMSLACAVLLSGVMGPYLIWQEGRLAERLMAKSPLIEQILSQSYFGDVRPFLMSEAGEKGSESTP